VARYLLGDADDKLELMETRPISHGPGQNYELHMSATRKVQAVVDHRLGLKTWGRGSRSSHGGSVRLDKQRGIELRRRCASDVGIGAVLRPAPAGAKPEKPRKRTHVI
jgi:hypothetical protein